MKWVNWPTKLRSTKNPRDMNVLEISSTEAIELITMNMTPIGVTLCVKKGLSSVSSKFALYIALVLLLTGGISA